MSPPQRMSWLVAVSTLFLTILATMAKADPMLLQDSVTVNQLNVSDFSLKTKDTFTTVYTLYWLVYAGMGNQVVEGLLIDFDLFCVPSTTDLNKTSTSLPIPTNITDPPATPHIVLLRQGSCPISQKLLNLITPAVARYNIRGAIVAANADFGALTTMLKGENLTVTTFNSGHGPVATTTFGDEYNFPIPVFLAPNDTGRSLEYRLGENLVTSEGGLTALVAPVSVAPGPRLHVQMFDGSNQSTGAISSRDPFAGITATTSIWQWAIIGIAVMFTLAFLGMCWQLRRLQQESNRLLARRALMLAGATLEGNEILRDPTTGVPLRRQSVLSKSVLETFPIKTFDRSDAEAGGDPTQSEMDLTSVAVDTFPFVGKEEQPVGSRCVNQNCPICIDDFVDGETEVRELPCSHLYHVNCIDEWLMTRSTVCPMCKHDLSTEPHFILVPVVVTPANTFLPVGAGGVVADADADTDTDLPPRWYHYVVGGIRDAIECFCPLAPEISWGIRGSLRKRRARARQARLAEGMTAGLALTGRN